MINETMISDAIIEKFFEPTTLLVPMQIYDKNGIPHIEYPYSQREAPMMEIARGVWEAKKAEIMKGVIDSLDVDAIVEQCSAVITNAVVAQLVDPATNNWSPNPKKSEREKMMSKVYDAVAKEFGRQCVEHLRQTGGLMSILEAPPEQTD